MTRKAEFAGRIMGIVSKVPGMSERAIRWVPCLAHLPCSKDCQLGAQHSRAH